MLKRSSVRFATISAAVNPNVPFLKHEPKGKTLPAIPTEITIDAAKPMEWLKFMTRMRRMEQNADICYKEKLIRGFLHLYSGQEAIPTGMGEYLDKEDSIITAYRCHVWHCLRGGTIDEVFNEMFGHQAGCSKGKGGSMHMYKESSKFYGGNGIVGAQVPIGTGLAWKYAIENGAKTPKNMCVTLYGDGAANQGQVFEAYNMASLWNLPVLYVVENNHYGMGTAAGRAAANTEFHRRGQYIPGIRADGNNIFSVMAATQVAREYILGGNGPLIIEFDTYRYSGHSMSDPGLAYRTPEEVKHVRETRDPITFMSAFIQEHGIADAKEIKKIVKACNAEVDEITEKAKEGEPTKFDEIHTDILTNPDDYNAHVVRSCQGTIYYDN